MKQYEITINWELDFVVSDAIKAEMRKRLERLKLAKEVDDKEAQKYYREDLKELSNVLKQIRAHKII